jgi:amino acid adenylation domain-containing protein
VNFKEGYADSLSLNGLTVEDLQFRQLGSGVDIGLTFHRTNGESGRSTIRLTAVIDVSKFSMSDAAALLETWRSVITQCVHGRVRSIDEIDILLPGERELIFGLSGRDDTADYPKTTLHAIFRQTAERYPDRTAVIEADGRETSYSELQAQVLRIAAFLRAQGIEKEAVVGVHMQRSSALLATIIGILEAGGAFLLLEPSLPLERRRTMAEQARVAALFTDEGLNELPGFEGRTHALYDVLSCHVADDSEAGGSCDPRALAYVMFTSGSTGVPKGAMVEHGNIVNRLSYTRHAMRFGMDDRALQKSPLSFDVCLTELLMPMLTGGAVVMADPGSEVDVQRIADLVDRHRASYLHFVPGVLKAFLGVPDVQKVDGKLRMIRCGGESLPDSTMRTCLTTLDARLYQSYGPAEAAVAVTLWECHNDHGHPKPPIGRPNSNVEILIMDHKGRPVPPGMSGELWIGGAQTGRGYINNEEETKKRFVDDPIEPGSGRRYYRTGDLARFLPDGNLLFLGRMDDQLKVRGVRIELGDSTSALLRCHGVREAVALPEPDGEGSNRLHAWVTLKDGSIVSESSIRSNMTEFLPGYMVPFRIHVVDAIPLTPHGKTDHRALRAMAEKEGDETEGLPFSTSTEHRLAAIWSELLSVEVKCRDADFFRLGGHSLVAMRLAGRIHRDFKLLLPLPTLYADPRLEHLAAWIDTELGKIENSHSSENDTYKTYTVWEGIGNLNAFSFFMDFRIVGKMAEFGRWEWSVVNLIDPQVQKGETPDMPVENLAPVYVDAILAQHRHGPIVLLGNCINGIDAYATACHLQHKTSHPIHVMLFDTRCPQTNNQPPKNVIKGIFSHAPLIGRIRGPIENAVQRMAEKSLQGSESAKKAIHLLASPAISLRLFDPEWYLQHHPDVARAGVDPLSHYFALGWRENRNPSLTFNATLYRSMSKNSRPNRQNPVLHYLLSGRFRTSVRKAVRELQTEQKDCERIMASGWFDADWYTREYPSVACRNRSPLEHFMAIGWRYARKPFPEYDPEEFCRRFPGFEAGKDNPLRHLLTMAEIPLRAAKKTLQTTDSSAKPHAVEKGERRKQTGGTRKSRQNGDDDILGLRGQIRRRYKPENFNGVVHVFSNQISFDREPSMGWRDGIHGSVNPIRMDGDHDSYLIDDFKSNAWKVDDVIRSIMDQEIPKA